MYRIAALYHFTRFDDPAAFRARFRRSARHERISGSLLLAREGINGTIAGSQRGYRRCWRISAPCPAAPIWSGRKASSAEQPFRRMKVRLKKEIVTMGQPDVDPKAPRSGIMSSPLSGTP